MNRFYIFIIALVLVFSTLIKIKAVAGFNFPFTMDQGRDMVDIRQMVVSYTPRLVGPTTSINGVLLGPFWYYFLLPPFILSGGNPQAIMYWQILWYQISAIVLWHVLKKKDNLLAFLITTLYLLMPMGFNTGRYFWNANAMPIFTGLFIASIVWTMDKISYKKIFFLGLLTGLSMQIEAAFGILFFPFAFIYLVLNKRTFKELLWLTSGFFVTVLPQILFELRHGFIMTKVLISEFLGKGEMLGAKISFSDRFEERYSQAVGLINFSSHLPPVWVQSLFILGVMCLVLSCFLNVLPKKNKTLYTTTLGFLLLSSAFYLLFPQSLKTWYTLGLCVVIVIVLAIAIYTLIKSNFIFFKAFGVYLFVLTVYYAGCSQLDYINNYVPKPSVDRSNLKNELSDIDWVYQNANGKGFKAYSYLPSVYDYPYHYLYWWYGTKKYGYQPADVAYLPGMPEYIKGNDQIWTKTRSQDSNNLTFLIIEKNLDNPNWEAAWLGNFSKLCLQEEKIYSWTARTQKLTNCHK